MKWLAVPLIALSASASAEDPALQAKVAAILAEAPPGTRIGLVVTDEEGREIVAILPDQRFVPASNTKMFTTAAAFQTLAVDAPDTIGGASVRMEGRDVVLTGHGDARLSSAADCTVDCLTTLADAVAAKTRTVRDVIGDDSWFPDQRWSPGMSWNNIPSRYGTGISALTIDDNELVVTVTKAGVDALPYYRIDDRVARVDGGKSDIGYDRMPDEDVLTLSGRLTGSEPEVVRVGIDDPAHFAAWRLRDLLRARGVKVTGDIRTRHRMLTEADDPARRGNAPVEHPPEPEALATLAPPPLAEDLRVTNKVSQNLHADLFLRRVGRVTGSGSIADGQAVVTDMLTSAGVERWRYDFADGSGMSSYNRLSPRGVVRFLKWTTSQPWGAAWRSTLPVGGIDGTLRRRFAGTPLDGKLFAKTGSLDKAAALSGFMTAASGKTLIFSSFANDMPNDASATATVDKALKAIAAAE
jgi:serine-type D-Ala-D-Ala carboxypeptidase/endopeptidase (penicillin-binding protein 4)